MRLLFLMALLVMPGTAMGTEYWSGCDDDSGERVEIVVRFEERLREGADVFVRDVRGSQHESIVFRAEFFGTSHARICACVDGADRCFSVSR